MHAGLRAPSFQLGPHSGPALDEPKAVRYTLACMSRISTIAGSWKLWAAAVFAAGLLELPFPIAGPLPLWRTVFAWFGLAPLLYAVLSQMGTASEKKLRRAFLLGYLSGFLWYMGNCYWVRDTMAKYGGLPTIVPVLLLTGFSLVLGLYFGLFALAVALVRRASGSARLALAAAPFLWVALELAAARITSVPWDQLGYSQVDNALVNQLAPWTGVYGISFVLVAVNSLIAGALVLDRCPPKQFWQSPRPWGIAGVLLMAAGALGLTVPPAKPAATALAMLIQPDLNVGDESRWDGPGEWEQHIAQFTRLAGEQCKSFIDGLPQTESPVAILSVLRPALPLRRIS
jgi:apolipoprotein N-acyltransferase